MQQEKARSNQRGELVKESTEHRRVFRLEIIGRYDWRCCRLYISDGVKTAE